MIFLFCFPRFKAEFCTTRLERVKDDLPSTARVFHVLSHSASPGPPPPPSPPASCGQQNSSSHNRAANPNSSPSVRLQTHDRCNSSHSLFSLAERNTDNCYLLQDLTVLGYSYSKPTGKNQSSNHQREVCHARRHLQPSVQLGVLILGCQDLNVPVIIYKTH